MCGVVLCGGSMLCGSVMFGQRVIPGLTTSVLQYVPNVSHDVFPDSETVREIVDTVVVVDSTEDVEVEEPKYILRLMAVKPLVRLASMAHDSLDTVEFIIANTGTVQSPAARLLVTMSEGKKDRFVGAIMVAPIAAGKRIAVTAHVPHSENPSVCYKGTVEAIDSNKVY